MHNFLNTGYNSNLFELIKEPTVLSNYRKALLLNIKAIFSKTIYQKVFQLERLGLSVLVGEFVGITGAVGSGKSSLLELIVGEMQDCIHFYILIQVLDTFGLEVNVRIFILM